MNENKKQLSKPSKEIVAKYVEKWNNNEMYVNLDKILFDMCEKNQSNTDVYSVYIKCCVINATESTQVPNKDLYDIAKNITAVKDIDNRIKSGDLSVVIDIAECGIGKNLYSFAAKYCCAHNKNAFPKKDELVVNMLQELNEYKFTKKVNKTALNNYKNYEQFVNVINDFRNHFGLNEFSYKEIDQYLWQVGKTLKANKRI